MAIICRETTSFDRFGLALCVVALGIAVTVADAQVPGEADRAPLADRLPNRLAIESPSDSAEQLEEWVDEVVEADEATDIDIEAMSEIGYVDEQGRYVVDLLEQEYGYLAVRLATPDGRSVRGARPTFAIEGTSRLLEPQEVSPKTVTDETGVVQFAVVGGKMGLDRIKVAFGDAHAEILVNVISIAAAGLPALPVLEDGLSWKELMQARIRYEDTTLLAEFPAAVADRAGQTLKLSGYMMPLEADLEQRRFLLTLNPPSCFFHVPGGPSGAVEVFATEGIKVSEEPVVLEGRFEPQNTSEIGVVYRLHDARLATR